MLLDDLHYNDWNDLHYNDWNDLHYNDWNDLHYNDWNDLHYNDCALFDAGGKLHPNKPVLPGYSGRPFGVQRRR